MTIEARKLFRQRMVWAAWAAYGDGFEDPDDQSADYTVALARAGIDKGNYQFFGTFSLAAEPPDIENGHNASAFNNVGYVAHSDEDGVIVSFRGTIFTFFDWVINDILGAFINLPYLPGMVGRVHAGMHSAFSTLFWNTGLTQQLQTYYLQRYPHFSGNNRVPLTITGHSKGGAMAYIAAPILQTWAKQTLGFDLDIRVVTFGAPRVGDAVFADAYNKMYPNTTAFIYNADIVPHLPISWYVPVTIDTKAESSGQLQQQETSASTQNLKENLDQAIDSLTQSSVLDLVTLSPQINDIITLAMSENISPEQSAQVTQKLAEIVTQHTNGLKSNNNKEAAGISAQLQKVVTLVNMVGLGANEQISIDIIKVLKKLLRFLKIDPDRILEFMRKSPRTFASVGQIQHILPNGEDGDYVILDRSNAQNMLTSGLLLLKFVSNILNIIADHGAYKQVLGGKGE